MPKITTSSWSVRYSQARGLTVKPKTCSLVVDPTKGSPRIGNRIQMRQQADLLKD